MKKCPFCAEEIQDEAVVCKHCGNKIDKKSIKESKQKGMWWYKSWFITVLFFLGLLLFKIAGAAGVITILFCLFLSWKSSFLKVRTKLLYTIFFVGIVIGMVLFLYKTGGQSISDLERKIIFTKDFNSSGEPINPRNTFHAGKVYAVIKHTSPFGVDKFTITKYKISGSFEEVIDKIETPVSPDWNFAKIPLVFSEAGKYKLEIRGPNGSIYSSGIINIKKAKP